MKAWWADEPVEHQPAFERRYPGRIASELEQLGKRGTVLSVRRDIWDEGLLGVEYRWSHAARAYDLLIVYPTGFPRLRPDVLLKGDPATFPRRHCDPLTGAICYLGQSPHEWRPSDSIAELIDKQLPKILDATFTPEEEEPVPEPAERWWNDFALENSCFLIDSAWSVGHAESGSLKLAYVFAEHPFGSLRCVATEIADSAGKVLATWAGHLPREFRHAKTLIIPWRRAGVELFPKNSGEVFHTYRNSLGSAIRPRRLEERITGSLFAVVHPTELEYGMQGDSWILFITFGGPRDFATGKETKLKHHTVRTFRAGADDLTSRSPASSTFRSRKLVVLGAGAIGAPIALELARNAVSELTIVDVDRIGPGNSVRWPLGEVAWGYHKTKALADFIKRNYSHCCARAISLDIGNQLEAKIGDGVHLRAAIDEADLVIDATTSFGVLGSVYDYCSENGTTVLSLSATPPVTGGAVTAYSPDGGCPTCLLFHYAEATSEIRPPRGEGELGSQIAPLGCSERTFIGASFDLQELSLQALRLAVHILNRAERGELSVLQTLSFTDREMGRLPCWGSLSFGKHPSCDCKK